MNDEIETQLTEWEAIAGVPLDEALAAGTARAIVGLPYSLNDALAEQSRSHNEHRERADALAVELEQVRKAFKNVAEDRNMWRARAKRAARVARGME